MRGNEATAVAPPHGIKKHGRIGDYGRAEKVLDAW
jgi:hypothetical protein